MFTHSAPVCLPSRPPRSRHQFVQALYLIDLAKRGMPVPAALPPGPFPPVAGTVSLGAMQVCWRQGCGSQGACHALRHSFIASDDYCSRHGNSAVILLIRRVLWQTFIAPACREGMVLSRLPPSYPVPTLQGAPADIYSASLSIPGMVPQAVYQAQPVPPQPFASQVGGAK